MGQETAAWPPTSTRTLTSRGAAPTPSAKKGASARFALASTGRAPRPNCFGKRAGSQGFESQRWETATARQLELGSNCRSLAAPEPILLKRAAASRPEGLAAWGFSTTLAAPTADQRPTRASRTGRLPSPGATTLSGMFGAVKGAHGQGCASTAPGSISACIDNRSALAWPARGSRWARTDRRHLLARPRPCQETADARRRGGASP